MAKKQPRPSKIDPWKNPAGVDEVGRGCLFGPVVAAAVILPASAIAGLKAEGLTDSKKLSPDQRDRLNDLIRSQATTWALGISSVAEIDRINILQASLLAMTRALQKLEPHPLACLVDGNRLIPNLPYPQRTVVGGDALEPAIAAASIIAKVWRDRLIIRLGDRYPGYGFERHKGYGTQQHRKAIAELGLTPLHRLSFSPCQAAANHPTTITTQLELLGSDRAASD